MFRVQLGLWGFNVHGEGIMSDVTTRTLLVPLIGDR